MPLPDVPLTTEATSMTSTSSIKTSYEVKVSQGALAGVETVAKKFNLSVSELFERVGSGRLAIVDLEAVEDLEDYLDLQVVIEPEADPEDQERISWETVRQEIGL